MTKDRAAVVARAIAQIAAGATGHALELQVAVLLRDEFAEVARQAIDEIRLNDE